MSDKKFGLLGKSLAHSFSKDFFTDFFEENNVSAVYDLIELHSDQDLSSFFCEKVFKFAGLNVTVPYKRAVLPFLDEISDEAAEIGAVNTIKVSDSGKLIGYNTDAFGFHQSIKPYLDFNHNRALIIGTGGASKAVDFVLKKIGLDVFFISRNPQFDRQFAYADMNVNMIGSCKLIVNCTPIGMYPDVEGSFPFPYEFLTKQHLIIDLIYNPEQTNFLREAESMGSVVLNGKSMLYQQAMKSWELWSLTS